MGMTYAGSGVDYGTLDPFKRLAQKAGRTTAPVIGRFSGRFEEFEPSRGESAYLIETADGFLAHVEEGLGTKNLVADAIYKLTGKSYYDSIAQDTVAMIVNDMVTVGAMPLSVAMHLAVGDSAWFNDVQRTADLVAGWQKACLMAGAVWGGGETPTLKGLITPEGAVLAGSAMGFIRPKRRLLSTEHIQHGDTILLLGSSGIHANGLTMARNIASKLEQGYLTKIGDGDKTYGEALLEPTHIYVRFIEACLNAGISLHYVVNITGHGWRKLMRAPGAFTYVIDRLPKQQPLFVFMQERGPIDDREAYANLNMGAGFAIYLHPEEVSKVEQVMVQGWAGAPYPHTEIDLTHAGYIEKSDTKKVVIRPKNLEFSGADLMVR